MTSSVERPYPELTWPGILTGWFLGAIIAIAIGYAALILGFSIEGSELAAILGFGILRGILGRKSIIENNIAQTAASSVNAASSGIMFSVPAIFILGYGDQLNPWLMTFGCIAGAFLGIAFIIPLRKQMIDFERLTYPGGVAVATILKSPGAGVRKAGLLLAAGLASGGFHAFTMLSDVGNWNVGALLGMPAYMNTVFYLSLLTVGVGFIAGRGGVAFIIGGFLVYWVVSPLLAVTGAFPTDPETGTALNTPGALRLGIFRPLGIGMLIGGALMGVALSLPLVRAVVRAMGERARQDGDGAAARARDELPVGLLYGAIVGAAVVLCIIAVTSVGEVGLARGILMGVLGTLWIWMAGIILSEAIGRTNWSPLSGMTLIGVTILIFLVSDMERSQAITAAIMVGAATAVAMSQATDLMLDLKTGYLVGATPRLQQLAQFSGAWLGPLVVIGLVFVLHQSYGLGSEQLPAPQGQALAATIDGILGGNVPVEKYAAGALIGALLTLVQGGLGILVALGFYLPFNIVLTYAIGTGLRETADRFASQSWTDNVGIPLAAGAIVGEALVGVGFAIHAVITG